MYSLPRKLAKGAAACGLALFAFSAPVSAAAITYTDFGAFQAAASALTTDSFEAAPWLPTWVKPQGLSNLGVSWTAANELFASGSFGHSGRNSITSLDGTNGGDIFDWIEAVLPANVKAVGGWITSFNMAHDTRLLAYDGFGSLLGSVALDNTGNAFEFLGLISDTAIAKVRFMSTNVTNPIGDDFNLDDFSFGSGNVPAPMPVPEPSGLALLGAALAGLAFGRRRKAAPGDLDRRTLADIGIGPGEIAAVADGIAIDRLRHAPHG